MDNIIRVGLDIHGVIDKAPSLFSTLTHKLIEEGHEVHILTGVELGNRVFSNLEELNINYTQVFSITSYHKEIGTYVAYRNGDPHHPIISPPMWDRTKADYAERVGLDVHIDDSQVYGLYFKGRTVYIHFSPAVQTFLEILAGKFDLSEALKHDGYGSRFLQRRSLRSERYLR